MFSWHEFPMLRILLAFIVGITTARYFDLPTSFLLYGILLALLTYALFSIVQISLHQKAIGKSFLLLIIFLGIGAYRYNTKVTDLSTTHYSHHLSNHKHVITGVVQEPPLLKNRIRTTLQVNEIQDSLGATYSAEGLLLAYFDPQDKAINYQPGDQIILKANILPTLRNTNPYAFDYKSYLQNRGVFYQAFIKEQDHHLTEKGTLYPIQQFASDVRLKAVAILDEYLPVNDEKAVVAAMILGYRNNITPDLYTSFTDTGVVHVLAVSGLHVGIIALLINLVLGRIRSNSVPMRLAKSSVLVIALIFYVLLTGAAPAVVRAAVMMVFLLVGQYVKEDTNIYNSLGMAGFSMLSYDPSLLFQASFQFSFLALTSIVFFHPILSQLWTPQNKLVNKIWQLSIVAVSAQILVFPVTIYYFHKFPTYFMLSGIIAIPAAFIIIYTGIGLLILAGLGIAPLAKLLALLLSTIVGIFNGLITLIQSLPGNVAEGLWMETSTMVLLYVMLACIMLFVTLNYKTKWLQYALLFLLIATVGSSFRKMESTQQSVLTVYDIYNGYAIDFINGRKVYSLHSPSLTKEKLHFAVHNNRIQYGADTETTVNMLPKVNEGRFVKRDGFFQLDQHQIYVTDKYDMISECIHVDIAIISRNYSGDFRKLLEMLDAEQIIIDKSLGYKKAKLLMKICTETGQHCRSIYTEGAITIDTNN